MSVADNLKRGSVDLLILTLLQEEDMYGYQISQELVQRSDGKYHLKETSLYPILYRLIDKKYITEYKVVVGKRRTRVYYHIEPAGIEYHSQALQDYLNTVGSVLKMLGRKIEINEE